MGGRGSGTWYRWGKKSTTTDYYNLSIKRLVEEGVIDESQHRSGSWQWLVNSEVTSSISYTSNTLSEGVPYIQLKYINKQSEESFDYKVELTTTTPHYGGKRWWFICPASGCGRRVAILYGGGNIYACRHCYKLAYDSQNEAPHYRYLHKAQKIHEKLGGSGCTDEYTPKPKGMHWKTYNRLMDELERYDSIALMSAARKFGIYH